WDDALDLKCEYADCTQVFVDTLAGCPQSKPLSCIPLAVIHDFVPGETVTDEQIDNWSARPRLVSTTVLDRAIHCILDKLPTKELTKITDTNWNHGDYYTCREFMGEFVAPAPHGKGLRIQFDSKVFAESINTRTLMATIVKRPRDPDAPRTIE